MDIRRKPIKYFKILIGIISDTIICVECSKLSNDATEDLPSTMESHWKGKAG